MGMQMLILFLAVFINIDVGLAATVTANATSGDRSPTSPSAVTGSVATTIPPYSNDTAEVPKVDMGKYPYRVCMALSTDLVRFDRNIECVRHNRKTPMDEGIMIVYKENIVAYTFEVVTYYKDLIFQRSYKAVGVDYLLGTTVNRVAMPIWEIDRINRANLCYSAASRKINGVLYVSYHEDNYKNLTMMLTRDDYSSKSSVRYTSTKDLYHTGAYTWFYTESCTVNCVMTVTKARSKSPYSFFVLSSGEVVEVSPFYNGENSEVFEENTSMFWIRQNYTIRKEFGQILSDRKIVDTMAFLEKTDSTIMWEVKEKEDVTCKWKLWQAVNKVIRTDQGETFHFASKSLTATFVTKKENISYSNETGQFKCIHDEFMSTLDSMYDEEYNETHDRVGPVEMYRTTGGLIVLWQKLVPKSLKALQDIARLHNMTELSSNHSRRKRDADDGPIMDIGYTQLQFTYDILRNYINEAMGNILDAWCQDQKRTAEMLKELSKINPSTIISAIYDKPMSARLVGDVIALANCMSVDQDSVKILKDMRIFSDGKVVSCYSRPQVLFQFPNSTKTESGQLGENNEILLGTHRTEACEMPSRRIFVSGNVGYEYRNYRFKNLTDLKDIEVLDTMIKLDIEPLENTDFHALELYSRGEIKASNVFNLEEIMREYNAQKQHIRYLTSKVTDPTPSYLLGLDQFMQGLGVAGYGLGVALGAVGGAVTSIVSGIASFLSNPFGAFTIIIIAAAAVLLLWLVFTRQQNASQRPVEYFFPYATQAMNNSAPATTNDKPPPYEKGRSGYDGNVTSDPDDAWDEDKKGGLREYSEQEALEMLRALKRLEESKRNAASAEKDSKKNNRGILDRLKGKGYERLADSSDVDD
uniref:Envelope glycoprotein B n=1 Tax=Mastomys natalensis cytomegalovirus 2 TaxID=2973540 RepID=A0A9Y1N7Z7_9BETA|nr:envelope glycoprotein B [Mastomys natalensis cytomegalovirus 2]WEG69200.1 envelope glycoprotein B [Mastomys natalensis cytomegalovirus 2]WEG69339.1 envelope glycoprotein B [Mastomys natalensis cytomegalovirus 2]WEG69477.1 envelope glycoprotein B [Mastomys natalensis cytomegalovirus 2]WEG69615.1 envelope glycoprotein B [Mastomys natalensis cytomegalovirus 2]